MKIKTSKFKPVLIPTNKADPINMGGQVKKSWKWLDWIFRNIKKEILESLNRAGRLTVNINLTAAELATLYEEWQSIIDKYLFFKTEEQKYKWFEEFIAEAYEKGAHQAISELSTQSEIYKELRVVSSLMHEPYYQERLMIAFTASYDAWKGFSVVMRTDLSKIIGEAVLNGDNVKETARKIKQRLNISHKRARLIAQTEQLEIYRLGEWDEVREAQELGFNAQLLHISALKPTTRITHAQRHGKIFTVEDVEAWYQRDGNRYNCYCKQSLIIVNDDGTTDSDGVIADLSVERRKWLGVLRKSK